MIPCAFALDNEIYTNRTAVLIRLLLQRSVTGDGRAAKMLYVEEMAEFIGVAPSTIHVYSGYKPGIDRSNKPSKLQIIMGMCAYMKVDIALFFHVVVNQERYPDLNAVVDDIKQERLKIHLTYSLTERDQAYLQNGIGGIIKSDALDETEYSERINHERDDRSVVEPHIIYVRHGPNPLAGSHNTR